MGSASGGLDKELKQESHTPDKGSPDGSPHRGGDAKGRGGLHIMKKKQYIAPEVEIAEIEMVSMMAASAPNIGFEDGEGGEILSNGRRGKWGNLWSDDESK